MSRLYVSVFIASCLLFPASALAQEAAAPAAAVSGPSGTLPQALVRGLAATDLLNVRADPSPMGKTLGRLPNGAFVEQHECKLVEGYEWCRVGAPEFDNLTGWTPARYLYPLDIGGAAMVAEEPEAAPSKEARVSPDQGETMPDGLEARFAGGSSRPIAEIMKDDDGAGTTAADPGIPVPTPRPDENENAQETPDPAEEIVSAAVEPRLETLPTGALPSEPMTMEIPCARYVGQPMARCTARVRRTGEEAADVTIAWPDGGTRTIEFREGLPAGSNSSGEFRFTREGSLNMIRIGVSERFEILDALPFDG